MKIFFFFLFGTLVFSCNTTQQANKGVAQKKETPPPIVYPKAFTETPAANNCIYDYGELFTTEEEKKIDTLVRFFERSNLVSIKVTTLAEGAIAAGDFEKYNQQVYREWDAMHGKQQRSISLLISSPLRKAGTYYEGDKLLRLLPASQNHEIFRNYFEQMPQDGQFFDYTYKGLSAMMDAIRKNINFNPTPISK